MCISSVLVSTKLSQLPRTNQPGLGQPATIRRQPLTSNYRSIVPQSDILIHYVYLIAFSTQTYLGPSDHQFVWRHDTSLIQPVRPACIDIESHKLKVVECAMLGVSLSDKIRHEFIRRRIRVSDTAGRISTLKWKKSYRGWLETTSLYQDAWSEINNKSLVLLQRSST